MHHSIKRPRVVLTDVRCYIDRLGRHLITNSPRGSTNTLVFFHSTAHTSHEVADQRPTDMRTNVPPALATSIGASPG